MRPNLRNGRQNKQAGYVLLLLLIVMGLGAVLYAGRSANSLIPARASASRMSPVTADALRQAKEALIGYAAMYPEAHAGETFGYLPLPDMGSQVDTSATKIEGKTALGYDGNDQNKIVIGRLPWYSLNLPALKDEHGECLWYAVSGTFKNNPKTDYMNWDTLGYLDVRSADGATSLFAAVARPAAVIFSAGPALAGQNRSKSSTDLVDLCGGNYDVRNYLDPYSATSATGNFTNWINNDTTTAHHAADSVSLAVKQLLASPLPGVTADTKVPNDREVLNDRAVFITPADIFKVVKKRRDFASFIQNNIIADAQAYITQCRTNHPPNYPDPSVYETGAGVRKGRLPTRATTCSGTPFSTRLAAWEDHFYYLVCTSGSNCISGNLGGSPYNCVAALIFAGERGTGQSRVTAEQRADPFNYLEGENYRTFTTAAKNLEGATSFSLPADGSPAATDVVICLL